MMISKGLAARSMVIITDGILVGGFKPSEKYESKWESSPNRVKIKHI